MYDFELRGFRISPSHCLRLAAAMALAVLASAPHGYAQQAQSAPGFEVATVKPSDTKNPSPESVNISPDRFSATGMTLKELIKVAYNLNYGVMEQVSGGPAWTGTTRFDLLAKEDEALSGQLEKLTAAQRGDRIRQMLRALLAERFGLETHGEKRDLPVYDLVVAKSGSKMLAPSSQPLASDNGKPENWIRFAGRGTLEGNNADLDTLSTVLAMQPEVGGRLVENKTGLQGGYNFTLKWTPETGGGTEAPGADAGPSLFTAVREQLGLQLEPAKAPVDMIVIDRAEMPTAN